MWHDPNEDYTDEVPWSTEDLEYEEEIYKLNSFKENGNYEYDEVDLYFMEKSWGKSINDYSKSNTYAQNKTRTRIFYIKAVGVTYGNRQEHIATLKIGEQLKLTHEVDNKYDSNALLITTENGVDIGYVGKESNKDLLEKLKANKIKSVMVSNITGEGYANKGVNIKIEIIEENLSDPPVSYKATDTTNTYSNNQDLPWGCFAVVAIVILILIIGLSGGLA